MIKCPNCTSSDIIAIDNIYFCVSCDEEFPNNNYLDTNKLLDFIIENKQFHICDLWEFVDTNVKQVCNYLDELVRLGILIDLSGCDGIEYLIRGD